MHSPAGRRRICPSSPAFSDCFFQLSVLLQDFVSASRSRLVVTCCRPGLVSDSNAMSSANSGSVSWYLFFHRIPMCGHVIVLIMAMSMASRNRNGDRTQPSCTLVTLLKSMNPFSILTQQLELRYRFWKILMFCEPP